VKTSLRHLVAFCALLVLVPALAACGLNAQTDKVYQPAIGTDVRGTDTDALGVAIVSAEEATGHLIFSLNNNSLKQADKLLKVSGDGLTIGEAQIEIPAHTLLNIADKPIPVTGEAIKAGNFVKLTFNFQSGETLTAEVPVVSTLPPFNDIVPSHSATPTKGSATPSASPTE